MLIQKLVEYAQHEGLADADPYFETKQVRWHVVISPEGKYRQLVPVGDEKRGRQAQVPKKVGGNAGGVATFGTDNPRFVLGYAEDEAGTKKAERDLPAFVALVDHAARQAPGVPAFAAMAAFYREPANIEQACADAAAKKVKDGDRIALEVESDNGIPVFETEAGKQFWREYRRAQEEGKTKADAVLCLSCGQVLPPVKTAEKLVGVPDGQPSGTSMVSFDKDAFQSLGWDQNANAPVCESCSFAYTQGLNHLLRRDNTPRSRVDQAGVAFEFWLDSGSAGDFVQNWLEEPDTGQAAAVLEAAWQGKPPPEPDGRLYALGLRGNGGRAVVVDWFETSLAEVYANLVRWFADLQVQLLYDEKEKGTVFAKAGGPSRPPRLWVLCRATARDDDGVSPRTPAAILRAALRGERLPLYVAEACIRRLPLDGFGDFFAPARIGLIRCTLNRRRDSGERELMPGLDPDNNDAAYLCGRLLATLEAVQYAGVGDVGANIIDRFYGKASTAPALVFGQLMTLAQSHLGAIDNDGQRVNLDRELSGIVAQLGTDFPRTLTLEEQGRFALGYYHQKAHRFAELRRRRDERAAAHATSTNGDQEAQ